MVLRIDPHFGEDWRAGRPAAVETDLRQLAPDAVRHDHRAGAGAARRLRPAGRRAAPDRARHPPGGVAAAADRRPRPGHARVALRPGAADAAVPAAAARVHRRHAARDRRHRRRARAPVARAAAGHAGLARGDHQRQDPRHGGVHAAVGADDAADVPRRLRAGADRQQAGMSLDVPWDALRPAAARDPADRAARRHGAHRARGVRHAATARRRATCRC